MDRALLTMYGLLLFGLAILILNHISILLENPWLIPSFLRIS
ncbi:MAG: hypothetical protein QNJ78_14210 [Gammaproteobacteria bacterium]|nr:hypothetical protein [Gammaproteobacteria bacterium]